MFKDIKRLRNLEGPEEPIEGEYREIPDDEEDYKEEDRTVSPGRPTAKDYERLRRERELEEAARAKKEWEKEQLRFEREAAERRARRDIAEQERVGERWKFEKSEAAHRRRDRTRREVGTYAKGAQKALTLGGMPATSPKSISKFYIGTPEKDLYVPKTPQVRGLGAPAAEALKTDASLLRRKTQLRPIETPTQDRQYMKDLVAPPGKARTGPLDYSFLRDIGMPKGLSRIEQAAFAEIHTNGDQDTLQHVGSELAKIGFPRREAEKAVKSLEEKGHVQKVIDKKGEAPMYEVIVK